VSKIGTSRICHKFEIYILVCVVKKIPILRRKMALETDQRIRLMNDIIHGIQTIKMYTWENSFIKLVETARR
jgi:hypothetical protein